MDRLLLIVFVCILSIPFPALASGIDYKRVTDHTNTHAIVKHTTFTEESWYQCNLQTLACTTTAPNTRISPVVTTPAYIYAYRALMPNGASNLRQSPDGRYIAFYIPSTQSRDERTFGVMDITSISTYTNTTHVSYWDLLTEGIRYYVFSPDSTKMIYLDDSEGQSTPYLVNLTTLGSGTTLKSERMFSKNYTVADVVWKDNNTIFFIANRDNPYAWALYELNINTYDLTKRADNVSYADNLEIIGNQLLFTQNTDSGIYPARYDFTTETVSHFNFPQSTATKTHGIPVTTLKEGLDGVFLLESSGASDTLLVWLHGGPYRQTSTKYHPYSSYGGYDWVLENLRDQNVGILKLDYPGSFGFGRAFAESITGSVGTIDSQKSAAAIADFAIRNGYTNVYVMGNSYGGYLSLKLLVDHPTLFKGAFSINGVADWLTLLTRLDTSIFNVQFAGTVDDSNRDIYQKASIYNYADKLSNQKILLMHGGSDSTIPVSQSEGLATYLSLNGKNVEFIKLDDENHVFKKPESFETLCKTALSFVERTNTASCEL